MRQQTTRRREGEAPPAPPALAVPVLDSHTHLDIVLAEVGMTEAEAIAAAAEVGVDRLVQVGVDVDSSRWGVRLAEQYAGVVATVALHPNDAPRLGAAGLD